MSIRHAGDTIKEIRRKTDLSQEELSEGICSYVSLSRIERGTSGVAPDTFQALTARAGNSREIFPVFENRSAYECFSALKHARFHLNAWQLAPACRELDKAERRNWNHNKLYYQEWLLLYGMLQFRSSMGNHRQMYDTFVGALNISKPDLEVSNIKNLKKLLLTVNEIELLISIAQEQLSMKKTQCCREICVYIYITTLKQAVFLFMKRIDCWQNVPLYMSGF